MKKRFIVIILFPMLILTNDLLASGFSDLLASAIPDLFKEKKPQTKIEKTVSILEHEIDLIDQQMILNEIEKLCKILFGLQGSDGELGKSGCYVEKGYLEYIGVKPQYRYGSENFGIYTPENKIKKYFPNSGTAEKIIKRISRYRLIKNKYEEYIYELNRIKTYQVSGKALDATLVTRLKRKSDELIRKIEKDLASSNVY